MSELKDYDTLEWLDCKNNVPPMNIDLYVDSEHGYGIGRLGRRVKDKSIIWTVHLDSGEVYLVYAFYKVKRWAYMPKDEKNNTKLKHELKAVHAFDVYEAYTKTGDDDAAQVYFKSEADKVIAGLEEILKNSRNARKYWRKEYLIEYKECSHQKYKRCLAMAEILERILPMTNRKAKWRYKWHQRWLAIAEKFKPNSTAQQGKEEVK